MTVVCISSEYLRRDKIVRVKKIRQFESVVKNRRFRLMCFIVHVRTARAEIKNIGS